MMTHRTIIAYHGELKHIITLELKNGRVRVACGHEHFEDSELETEIHDGTVASLSDEEREDYCSRCLNRVEAGWEEPLTDYHAA